MIWKKLASKMLLDHPRLKVVEDDILLPDGHESKYIYFADAQDAAMVVCVQDDKILLQTEYSYPPQQSMYQFPGGGMEPGEEPIKAALRELEEESGYADGKESKIQYLGYYFVNNRRSAAKFHAVLVTNPLKTGKTQWDPEEYIESEWVEIKKLREMIRDGKIVNSSVLTGLSLYDNRAVDTKKDEA